MKDINRGQEIKRQMEQRLRTAIIGIRRHLGRSADAARLDRYLDCAIPSLAYGTGEALLPICPRRPRCHTPVKLAIVFHEIGTAILRYWELVRTDDTTGLEHLIEKLEGYAVRGIQQCDLLGGPDDGYFLFNPVIRKKGR